MALPCALPLQGHGTFLGTSPLTAIHGTLRVWHLLVHTPVTFSQIVQDFKMKHAPSSIHWLNQARPIRLGLMIVLMAYLLIPGFPGYAIVQGDQVATPPIDFNRQLVTAWGLAGQPWESATSYEEEKSRAWMDSLHHAYEMLLSTAFMEGLEIRQVLRQYPTLRSGLGRVLLTATPRFFEEDVSKLIRCRVEIPFTGPNGLRSALFLAAMRPVALEPRAFIATDPVEASLTARLNLGPVSARGLLATGSEADMTPVGPVVRIVIDLRATFFQPSLFPRFYDEEGHFLFQEGRIPGPERFSRPVVRFSEEIADAEAGLKSEQLTYLAGRLPLTAVRDVVLRHPDQEFFRRFCHRLELDPLWKGEILIIHGRRIMPAGALTKSSSREAAKPATGAETRKTNRPARRRK